jgi:hypothetical protein
MHISENPRPSESELGNRMTAQFRLAELMGVSADQILDWCEKYAELFGEIEHNDQELSERIKSGTVTDEDLSEIRNQMGKYDTGAEETDEETIERAA